MKRNASKKETTEKKWRKKIGKQILKNNNFFLICIYLYKSKKGEKKKDLKEVSIRRDDSKNWFFEWKITRNRAAITSKKI